MREYIMIVLPFGLCVMQVSGGASEVADASAIIQMWGTDWPGRTLLRSTVAPPNSTSSANSVHISILLETRTNSRYHPSIYYLI